MDGSVRGKLSERHADAMEPESRGSVSDIDALPVVFIAGHSRSGSTLISRILGTVPGFCAVGELVLLWDHGVRRNDMCGCGARFYECDFWIRVGDEAFGGWDRINVADVLQLRETVVRMRNIPLLTAPSIAPYFRRRLERYTEIIGSLYRGIQAASGCAFVVDSSKWPTMAHAVRHVPGIDMRMVHLVRSSHGVCYSCMKKMSRPDLDGALMPSKSPGRTALHWMICNFILDAFAPLGVPSMVLRYEDFIAEPQVHIERILSFLGRDSPGKSSVIRQGSVELIKDHIVAGNPMRIRRGQESLRVDEEWRTALSPRSKRLVTTLTAPGLLRYGYPVFRN
jgi:hypothetical protein